MIERTPDGLSVTSPMVMGQVSELLAAGRRVIDAEHVRIDLAGVPAADSSAIAVLLAWQRVAAAAGSRLCFANVPAEVLSLADLYGVDEVLALDCRRASQ